MSLFDFSPPLEPETVTALHPWAKRIKQEYAQRAKYAHNSVHNPRFPKRDDEYNKYKDESTKSSEAGPDLVHFKVIGVRVAKEFIYCSRLVEGLYKYRCKKFAPPVIRAVTTVEWPKVLNDIRLQYRGIAYCVKEPCIILMNDDILGGINELKEFVLSKYSYNLSLDYYKESIKEFAKFANSTNRSFVYMHFQINGVHIGTMIFMLYTDIAPNTCDNFMRLCKQTRGGYQGTPVHRIVKDCWIQCGGFALKDSGMTCENFIVPFDRRGVLGMANAERHVDCSTQFFIILQPAPWMKNHYVGFGQLVDGNATLEEIENTPAYYEAPTKEIKIYASGILNLECHDIMINKHTKDYINAHIENICEVGEVHCQELLDSVLKRIDEIEGKSVEGGSNTGAASETKRHVRKSTSKKEKNIRAPSTDSGHEGSRPDMDVNNDFDVESYRYEPEEYSSRVTSTVTADQPQKEEKLVYMPLTDVLYPGEVDSTVNLKKFLKGHYCLEGDLEQNAPRKVIRQFPPVIIDEMLDLAVDEDEESDSDMVLDSDDEKEINDFFKERAERVCFAGKNVKRMAKIGGNIFEGVQRLGLMSAKDVIKLKLSSVITDDELRQNRVKHADLFVKKNRHISLVVPADHIDNKIKRRQTGFVKNMDLDSFLSKSGVEEEEEEQTRDEDEPYIARKIRAKTAAEKASKKASDEVAESNGYRRTSLDEDDTHRMRLSTLGRLYEDVKLEGNQLPTLKNYRPILEAHSKHLLLTVSKNVNELDQDNVLHYRRSDESIADQLLAPHPLHRKRIEAKISADYFNTLEQHNQQTSKGENSIRSAEYAKTRPALSVMEYQTKNKKSKDIVQLKGKLDIGPELSTRLLGERPSTDADGFSRSELTKHEHDKKKPVSFLTLQDDPIFERIDT